MEKLSTRTFENIKLSTDYNDSLIPKAFVKDAQNVRCFSSEHDFGGIGVAANLKGNVDVSPSTSLTYSQNDIIKGYAKLETKGWIVYFLFNNANSKSYILLKDVVNNSNSKILLSDDYSGLTLRFQDASVIDCSIKYIDEERIFLFWTGHVREPRYLNIVKALANGYGDAEDRDISICKYSPVKPVTFTITGTAITENLVSVEAYQYTYKYIYDDNSASYCAPYSAINFDPKKTTTVFIPVDVKFVKKIEVFAKNVLGNNSNFYLIGTIDHDGTAGATKTIEHTGSSYFAISDTDVKLFNNSPIKAKTVDVVNGNVVALANYKAFYNDWDDALYSCTVTPNSISAISYKPSFIIVGYTTYGNGDSAVIYEPNGVFIVGDRISFGGSSSGGDGCQAWEHIINVDMNSPLLGSNYDKVSNRVIVPYCDGSGTNVFITEESGDRVIEGKEFCFNGNNAEYQLALLFHDKYGRLSNPYLLKKITGASNANFSSISVSNFSNYNKPSWATHLSFGITKDIRFSKYVEIPFGNAPSSTSGEQDWGLDYAESQGHAIIKFPSTAGYTASVGEIFDCIYKKNGSETYKLKMYVLQVRTTGENVNGDNPQLNAGNIIYARILEWGGKSIPLNQFYTVGNSADYVEKLIFYEKQNNENLETIPFYQIPSVFSVDQFTTGFTAEFSGIGDYYIKAKKTDVVRFYIEKSTIDIGKPLIYEKSPIRTFTNTVIHSSDIIPQTNVNGLNKFYATAFQDCDRSKGSIQRIRYDDRGLIVWFEDGVELIPVNSSLIEQVDGTTLSAKSSKLLNQPRGYQGNFGLGLEGSAALKTLDKLGTQWYWYSPINKCICRLGGDGITDISKLYNARKLTLENVVDSGSLIQDKYIGGVDDLNSEYILTVFKDSNTYKTISIGPRVEGFTPTYSYKPQGIISLRNALYTFNEGKLYKHGSGSINTFYGQKSPSKITFVFNEDINVFKTFGKIEMRSKYLWIPTLLKTDFNRSISLTENSFLIDGVYDNINGNFVCDKISFYIDNDGKEKSMDGYLCEVTLEYNGDEPNYLTFVNMYYNI